MHYVNVWCDCVKDPEKDKILEELAEEHDCLKSDKDDTPEGIRPYCFRDELQAVMFSDSVLSSSELEDYVRSVGTGNSE